MGDGKGEESFLKERPVSLYQEGKWSQKRIQEGLVSYVTEGEISHD